ncbi:TMEM14 family protein [Pseudanabaena sp. FACHB-2040]|nr:TMEM14 family protein [Pseudanabaena sp. FACHB-2040]
MSLGALAAIAYGILAIVGGAIGYAQVRSKASLISGLVSGALLILGGWLWSRDLPGGVFLSLIVTIALVIVFIGRFRKTGKFMPAGLMIGLGALTLGLMVFTLVSQV